MSLNMKLVKIASIGGIATVMMGYAARKKIESNIKTAPFYKEALQLVQMHPAAVHLLGQPIKDGRIDVSNSSKNSVESNFAKFEVPLRGPKQTGKLFISAVKGDGDDNWRIERIELEAKNIPDKRLLIKSKPGS